jgi:hypothetical protein
MPRAYENIPFRMVPLADDVTPARRVRHVTTHGNLAA